MSALYPVRHCGSHVYMRLDDVAFLWSTPAGPGDVLADQLPYGTWAQGRFAWLLADPQRLLTEKKGAPGLRVAPTIQ